MNQSQREEGTGKTQCHGAKEKGLQEKGSYQCVESCQEVKKDED